MQKTRILGKYTSSIYGNIYMLSDFSTYFVFRYTAIREFETNKKQKNILRALRIQVGLGLPMQRLLQIYLSFLQPSCTHRYDLCQMP